MTKVYDVWHVSGRTDTNALVRANNREDAKTMMMRWMGNFGQVKGVESPKFALECELFTANELDQVSESELGTVWIYDQGT